MLEALSPGVEDHQSANRRAQAFRVGRDLQQRRRGGPKQEVVHDALVGQRETRQRLRHREDEVDVADGQEFLLPRRHPGVAGGREALGAMPIPTAVVREGRLRTLIAAIAVPAECRRSALGDGPEDAPMLARSPRRGASPENDRRVGARCRPPRRVAASPLVLQPRSVARCRAPRA